MYTFHSFAKTFTVMMSAILFLFACADQDITDQDGLSKSWGEQSQEQPQEVITFELSSPNRCMNPCVFSVKADPSITQVNYSVDGYDLGKSLNATDGYSISYEFSMFGNRTLVAVGYNMNGEPIAKVTQEIVVEAPPAPEGGLDIPYFYQYNNAYSPSATCQNTSIAMVLNYLGVQITPDDITARYGKDYAQSPAGLAELFNVYADQARTAKRIYPTTNGTLAGLREELDRGEPVIIHGYFTSYGHVLVVTGYDAQGYYVNDPAGSWNGYFKGGYGGPRDSQVGRNIYYDRAAFESAIATSDGYSSLPLWYHALR